MLDSMLLEGKSDNGLGNRLILRANKVNAEISSAFRNASTLLGVFRAIFRSVGSPDHRNRVYSWGRKISGISAWRSEGFFQVDRNARE